jgi:hypothetical protein
MDLPEFARRLSQACTNTSQASFFEDARISIGELGTLFDAFSPQEKGAVIRAVALLDGIQHQSRRVWLLSFLCMRAYEWREDIPATHRYTASLARTSAATGRSRHYFPEIGAWLEMAEAIGQEPGAQAPMRCVAEPSSGSGCNLGHEALYGPADEDGHEQRGFH